MTGKLLCPLCGEAGEVVEDAERNIALVRCRHGVMARVPLDVYLAAVEAFRA